MAIPICFAYFLTHHANNRVGAWQIIKHGETCMMFATNESMRSFKGWVSSPKVSPRSTPLLITLFTLMIVTMWWIIPSNLSPQALYLPPTESNLSSPRVFIDCSNMYNPSGGPEALLQLSLAFFSFLPHLTHIVAYKDNSIHWDVVKFVKFLMSNVSHLTHSKHPQFQADYPDSAFIPLAHTADLRSGDIFILPEIFPCPQDLVARGVDVYIWVLAADNVSQIIPALSRSNCSMLSHNFWLSHALGVNLPAKSILRPYITPSLLPPAQIPLDLTLKENLILIDNDTPAHVVEKVVSTCVRLSCRAVVVRGFTRPQLLVVYRKAKIVIDWCMRGNERMPIEAVLHGALLVSSACGSVQDRRDFPMPSSNILPAPRAGADPLPLLEATIERLLTTYHEEHVAYEAMRALHGVEISDKSLLTQARAWYVSKTHPARS